VRGPQRWVAGLLAGGFVLAVATPFYLSYSRPSVAGYLLHPSVYVLQALPYGLAAALWLPRWSWSWRGDATSTVLAALLLATSLALYGPVVLAPRQWGGDMIALAFLAMSGATTAVILILSGVTALIVWLQRPRAS
jgi:hypothetical protein